MFNAYLKHDFLTFLDFLTLTGKFLNKSTTILLLFKYTERFGLFAD